MGLFSPCEKSDYKVKQSLEIFPHSFPSFLSDMRSYVAKADLQLKQKIAPISDLPPCLLSDEIIDV